MATTVKITETYDLKTTKGKMGIIGIHTPTVALLKKMYPGLMKNHRFVRFVKCDVVGACASVLPADPLQVGVDAGEIAPEDMFNPILYTAVSNSSFDTLIARIYQLSDLSPLNSVAVGDAVTSTVGESATFQAYYALLAENGKFRKAMPQSGFKVSNLVPLCHTIISTYGNVGPQGNDVALGEDGETPVYIPEMDIPALNDAWTDVGSSSIYFRGRAVKMPKFPLHYGPEGPNDIPTPNIPKTFVMALLTPPGKLHEFYYRMRVTWTVRFEGVCSNLEAGNFTAYSSVGASAHGTNYSYSSSKSEMEADSDMVSADDVEINKIMES